MDKIYLNQYIMSFNKVNNYLNILCKNYSDKIKKCIPIGYTNFCHPINLYKIGKGKNHVLLIANTHGTEIVTCYFILEFITTLLKDNSLYNQIENVFTFHIIPILNPDGYIISTSNILPSTSGISNNYLQKLSSIYLEKYNIDDEIAKNCKAKTKTKNFQDVLNTSTCYIENHKMKKSICTILKKCGLDSSILPVWSANGVGIDPNSNSIHRFCDMVNLRKKQRYAHLRYNNIPVTKPSPMSFPGECSLTSRCPENVCLYEYIMKLYKMNYNKSNSDKLIAIFSYHSTGGEIYGYPDKKCVSNNQYSIHLKAMNDYSCNTGYKKIDEKLKYGVMDFYRIYLQNVVTLTIELSKLNGNPIGPFSNLESLNKEIILNKRAIINVLNNIIK